MIICLSFLCFEFVYHKIPAKLLSHNINEVKPFRSDDMKLEEMKQVQNIIEHTQMLQENWKKFILYESLNAIDVRAKYRLFGEDLSDLLATLSAVGSTHGISIPINVNERKISS